MELTAANEIQSPSNANWCDLIRIYRDHPIEAPSLKAVTLAQWMVESFDGTSPLATHHRNYASLPFRPYLRDMATSVGGVGPRRRESYCHFSSLQEFIRGYWAFIERGRYIDWRRYSDNPMGFIHMLWEGGYAAAPNYIDLVASRLEESERLLGDLASHCEPYQDKESGRKQKEFREKFRKAQLF